jgi:hypothetical protein
VSNGATHFPRGARDVDMHPLMIANSSICDWVISCHAEYPISWETKVEILAKGISRPIRVSDGSMLPQYGYGSYTS